MVFTPVSTTTHSLSPLRRWLGLALFVLTVGGGLGYVVLTNVVATKGYEIRQLEQQLKDLKAETKKLEDQAAVKQSSAALQLGLPPETYVAVQRIEYLVPEVPQVGVAVR